MIRAIILIALLFASLHFHAQTWNWAQGFGSDLSDDGFSIAHSINGDIYVTGAYDSDTLIIGSDTLFNVGGTDLFVLKLDSNGVFQWAKGFGSTSTDRGSGIAVDGNGDAYITGSNGTGFTFGTTTLNTSGTLTLKIGSNGNPIWAKNFGIGNGLSICMINDTTFYFTGNYGSGANFAPFSLPSATSFDLFIAKLDTSGQVILAYRGATGSGGEGGQSIFSDSIGRTTVVGIFDDDISFPTDTYSFPVSFPDRNVFIAQFESDGSYRWSHGLTGPGSKSADGITMDQFGNSFLSGFYLDSLYLSSDTFTSSNGGLSSDLMMVKFDSNGIMDWFHSAGGTNSAGTEIVTDNSGNVFMTGRSFSPDTFDTVTFPSSAQGRIFIAKYTALGNAVWVKKPQAGGPASNALTLNNHKITITGSHQFGATFDSFSFTSNGSNDILLAQLELPPCPTIQPNFTINCLSDSTVELTADAGYDSYKWNDGQFGQSIEVAATGTYYLVVSDSNNCTGTAAPQSVEVSPPVNVIASGPLELCTGGSVGLKVDTTYASYQWSTGSIADSIAVTSSDSVTVTVTDVMGCVKVSEAVVINVYDPQPVIIASGSTDLCEGESVTLTTSSPYDNYTWTGGSNGPSLTVSQAGSYNVTVSEGPGCTDSANNVNVTVTSSHVSISGDGPLEFCVGGDFTFSSIAANVSNYLWSTGATTPTLTVTQSDTISLAVTFTNACTAASNEHIVSVHPFPAPPQIILSGPDLLSIPSGFASYQWYLDGSLITGAASESYFATQSGDYMVVVTDSNDCQSESAGFSHLVGIEENLKVDFHVYPNPSDGTLFIKTSRSNTEYRCALFDTSGQLVWSVDGVQYSETISLNIGAIKNGIYLLEYQSVDEIQRQVIEVIH